MFGSREKASKKTDQGLSIGMNAEPFRDLYNKGGYLVDINK